MGVRLVLFAAVILTALALVPSGAHVLELANKIGLDRENYLTVQQIYRGWAWLGGVLIAAVLANGCAAVVARRRKSAMILAAAASILMCVTLGIFFTWTFPVNQATNNWTIAPAGWQALRTQWEYSHAASALVTFLALCSTTAASLAWFRA